MLLPVDRALDTRRLPRRESTGMVGESVVVSTKPKKAAAGAPPGNPPKPPKRPTGGGGKEPPKDYNNYLRKGEKEPYNGKNGKKKEWPDWHKGKKGGY